MDEKDYCVDGECKESLPNKVKTAKYTAPQHFDIVEIPMLELDDGETLIKVEYCSICGSDLHSYVDGKNTNVLGHEFVGVIKELGPNPPLGVKVGQRIVVNTLTPCGHCAACEKGYLNLCENRRRPNPGAYSQYIKTVHAGGKKMIYAVPDEVDSLQACMVEPLAVAVHAVNKAKVRMALDDTVVVFGAGAIGLLVTQVLRTIGALRIIQVDISDIRLRVAKQCGADFVINALSVEDIVKSIEDITGPGRNNFNQPGTVDVVFECAGTPVTVRQALDVIRGGGAVYQIALPQKDPTVHLQRLVYKEVTWQGIYCFIYEYPTALELLRSGKVNLHPIISHVFPLEKINEAFKQQMDVQNSVKVIVQCNE